MSFKPEKKSKEKNTNTQSIKPICLLTIYNDDNK